MSKILTAYWIKGRGYFAGILITLIFVHLFIFGVIVVNNAAIDGQLSNESAALAFGTMLVLCIFKIFTVKRLYDMRASAMERVLTWGWGKLCKK